MWTRPGQIARLGGEVALVEAAERVLAREAAPLGDALGEALRRDGIDLVLGAHVASVRHEAKESCCNSTTAVELHGDRLLVATGDVLVSHDLGLTSVGVTFTDHGIVVDEYLTPVTKYWAIGDVNGLWLLTHVGEYQGEVVAATSSANNERPTTRLYPASSTQTRRQPQSAQSRLDSQPRLLFQR